MIGCKSLRICPIFGNSGWYISTNGTLSFLSRCLSLSASVLDICLALSTWFLTIPFFSPDLLGKQWDPLPFFQSHTSSNKFSSTASPAQKVCCFTRLRMTRAITQVLMTVSRFNKQISLQLPAPFHHPYIQKLKLLCRPLLCHLNSMMRIIQTATKLP